MWVWQYRDDTEVQDLALHFGRQTGADCVEGDWERGFKPYWEELCGDPGGAGRVRSTREDRVTSAV